VQNQIKKENSAGVLAEALLKEKQESVPQQQVKEKRNGR
jgi:hypothetical protein